MCAKIAGKCRKLKTDPGKKTCQCFPSDVERRGMCEESPDAVKLDFSRLSRYMKPNFFPGKPVFDEVFAFATIVDPYVTISFFSSISSGNCTGERKSTAP